MLLTYQYKLNPTQEQVVTMETWGELLRRHYNYALGQRLDCLNRTKSQIDRCSLICEPIGEIPQKVDYYTQASDRSGCGERVEKTLVICVHNCSCGLVIDRDWNSALNLLKLGSVGLPIPGCGGLDVGQPVKQYSGESCHSLLNSFFDNSIVRHNQFCIVKLLK